MQNKQQTTLVVAQNNVANRKISDVRCVLSRGYTFVELLIVLAVLFVLMAVVIPSFSTFRRDSILNTDTMNVVTLINRARLLSISAKKDTNYGIHFESGKAVLFEGGTYSAGAPTNEVYSLNTSLTFSSITINGGGADVVFDKVIGSTSQNATTTLRVTGTTASSTIVIRQTGIVTTI